MPRLHADRESSSTQRSQGCATPPLLSVDPSTRNNPAAIIVVPLVSSRPFITSLHPRQASKFCPLAGPHPAFSSLPLDPLREELLAGEAQLDFASLQAGEAGQSPPEFCCASLDLPACKLERVHGSAFMLVVLPSQQPCVRLGANAGYGCCTAAGLAVSKATGILLLT